jgi:light-harvesting protein B-800-850 alpha chain
MNNGRIWCVVKPTVGLPLFLGGVAVIALAVHASVMTNTTWMADYWQGNKPRRAAVEPATGPALAHAAVPQATTEQPYVVNVMPVAGMPGDQAAFIVTIVPRATAPKQEVTLLQRAEPPPEGAPAATPTQ